MDMIMDNMATIITIGLGIATAMFGVKLKRVRKKFLQAMALLKTITDALEDNKITKPEIDLIAQAAKLFLGRETGGNLK